MTTINTHIPLLPDGKVDLATWLSHIKTTHQLDDMSLIEKAANLAESASLGLTTFYGQSCLAQGLDIASLILDLKLDQEAVAAGLLTSTLQHTQLPIEIVSEKTSEGVAKLSRNILLMRTIDTLKTSAQKNRDLAHIDKIRKTFLAMVADIRVAIIKLAQQMCIMRGIKHINPIERKRIAQETLDLYAPLANRLGIGQFKWELEDIAFHYTNPDIYKQIAKFLAERRIDRENRIHALMLRLKEKLAASNIKATISGRAKHIYSIYLKMQKKHLDLKNMYDVSAVRMLVNTVDDCYTVLSIVHSLYDHLPQEFDDYIAHPKPNGYRSIHTAVVDPAGKNLEVQIRTRDMHEEAEHGVAAHWIYKEKDKQQLVSGYDSKVTFLRQLLAWHKDISNQENKPNQAANDLFEDRIYAFTPAGDIIDLPHGATPLDFAYHIHSELGHRCRGAKINGHIVPLTHFLRTGDRVDILTIQQGSPSRDWLNKEAGYIKTPRARAKIMQWFNHQEVEQYINTAKQTLEREFTRAGIQSMDLQKIATRLHFKNANALLSSLGHGSIRAAQIIQAAQTEQHDSAKREVMPYVPRKESNHTSGLDVDGINDLLTRIARCCKPIPGDAIIGYITQGRGVTIHHQHCSMINTLHHDRLIKVNWDNKHLGQYYVDLIIYADESHSLTREIASVITHAKMSLISMNTIINKKDKSLLIQLTVQINEAEQLHQLMNQLNQLSSIHSIKRANQIH